MHDAGQQRHRHREIRLVDTVGKGRGWDKLREQPEACASPYVKQPVRLTQDTLCGVTEGGRWEVGRDGQEEGTQCIYS